MEKLNSNQSQYFIERDEAVGSEVEDWNLRRDRRLERAYKPSTIAYLWHIQDVVGDCYSCDDFYPLFNSLKGVISKKALKYGNRWNNVRLSNHNFESAFWEEAYRIFDNYCNYGYMSDFLYYETLRQSFEYRAKDVIRKATMTKDGIANNCAASLSDEFEELYADSIDIEKEVTDKEFVHSLINDDSLSKEENQLLKIMLYLFHVTENASLRTITKLIGMKHHQQVTRMLERIKRKLAKYEKAYNSDIKCGHPYGQANRKG